IIRIDGKTLVHGGARFVQPMTFLEQHRETDARVDASRGGRRCPTETGTGFLGLAHPLVLMADHADQVGIAYGETKRLLPGLIGNVKLAKPGRCVPIFSPDDGLSRMLAGEFFVALKCPAKFVSEQKLARFVEMMLQLRCRHAPRGPLART